MNPRTTQRLFLASIGLCVLGTIATRASAAPSDQAFVEAAYRANAQEVVEARYVLKNSQDAKTRAFAQMLIDDHTTANVKLLAAARTSDVAVPAGVPMVAPSSPAADASLAGLSGAPLSKQFFTEAIADHKNALDLLRNEAANGSSATLKRYASDTAPVVQKHYDIASQWVTSGGKLPTTIVSGSAPASAEPAAAPLGDLNGPRQSAAPAVQASETANPQPTTSPVVGTPLPTHSPGPP